MAKLRATILVAAIAAAVGYTRARRRRAPRFTTRPVFEVHPIAQTLVPKHHHHLREYGLVGFALFVAFGVLSIFQMRMEHANSLKTQLANLSVTVLPPGIPSEACRIGDFFTAYFAEDLRCDLDRNGAVGAEDLSLVLLGEDVLKDRAKNGTME